jgi:Protein of unknown function (DUF3631)
VKDRVRARLEKLHRLLGSDNAGERENARTAILKILHASRKTWNDLTELLKTEGQPDPSWNVDDDRAPPPGKTTEASVSALDVIHYLLEQYVSARPHEYVAIALWILHTHVYDQFMTTPRLAVVSPVRGCGKSTVLVLLQLLTARGRKEDGITPAAIIRLINRERPTLLLDEADNADLARSGALRRLINGGHERTGSYTHVIGDEPRKYSTFAPMAIAAIGTLPLPTMHRSVVIHMERSTRQLRRFDGNDRDDIDIAYTMARVWARDVKLNHNPKLPDELRNRPADNWRPLISIADSFGRTWGTMARKAAIEFARAHADEDAGVTLLNDIYTIFRAHRVDRLASVVLVAELIALDDSPWADWRGLRDDQQPRRLSPGELARLLAPFDIKPKSIWPPGERTRRTKSAKGYLRSQFEPAWRAYCGEGGTPSQPSKNGRLRAG